MHFAFLATIVDIIIAIIFFLVAFDLIFAVLIFVTMAAYLSNAKAAGILQVAASTFKA